MTSTDRRPARRAWLLLVAALIGAPAAAQVSLLHPDAKPKPATRPAPKAAAPAATPGLAPRPQPPAAPVAPAAAPAAAKPAAAAATRATAKPRALRTTAKTLPLVCERRDPDWRSADAKVGALVRAEDQDRYPAYGHCYGSVDLDGDGTLEIVAVGRILDTNASLFDYCSNAGCPLQAFYLRDGAWARIADGINAVPPFDGQVSVSAPDKAGLRRLFDYYFDRAAGRFVSRRPAAASAGGAVIATAPPPPVHVPTAEEQAQAVVSALTLECVPANSKLLGGFQGAPAYEVKCNNGFGYLLFKFAQEPVYRAMSCAAARMQPNGLRCVLMRDEDVFEGVKPLASQQDPKCVQTRIAWAGSTADQSSEQYRVSCRGFLHPDVVVTWQNYRGTPRPLALVGQRH